MLRLVCPRSHSGTWFRFPRLRASHAPTGYGGPRTLPHHYGVVLPRRTGGHPRSVLPFPPHYTTLRSRRHGGSSAAHVKTVYDVSNRESFEALPRWLEELENYVPP